MSPGITAARQAELNSGQDESRTLAEILAITHSTLLTQVVPEAPEGLVEAAKRADSLGILARMQAMGEALYTHLGHSACLDLANHPVDTVRGWAVFALVSQEKDADVDTLLALVRPAADDPHFGVREWAWMAVRPHLVPRLDEAIRAAAMDLGTLGAHPALRQRVAASAGRVGAAHSRAQEGAQAGPSAARAAACRLLPLCAGLRGELDQRRRQDPARLGQGALQALAGGVAHPGH